MCHSFSRGSATARRGRYERVDIAGSNLARTRSAGVCGPDSTQGGPQHENWRCEDWRPDRTQRPIAATRSGCAGACRSRLSGCWNPQGRVANLEQQNKKRDRVIAGAVSRLLVGDWLEAFYPVIPKVGVGKLARFGKIDGKSVGATPNHCAKVAAYWST